MFFPGRENVRIYGGLAHMKLETGNTVSCPPGAQRPENRPLPRPAGLLRRRLPRFGHSFRGMKGNGGWDAGRPRPPTDGQPATDRRCGSLASVMVLPSPLLPVANAAAANWESGLKTGNIGTLATLPALSTVNTSKTGRFVMTTVCKLWSSQNLPLFRIDF